MDGWIHLQLHYFKSIIQIVAKCLPMAETITVSPLKRSNGLNVIVTKIHVLHRQLKLSAHVQNLFVIIGAIHQITALRGSFSEER